MVRGIWRSPVGTNGPSACLADMVHMVSRYIKEPELLSALSRKIIESLANRQMEMAECERSFPSSRIRQRVGRVAAAAAQAFASFLNV